MDYFHVMKLDIFLYPLIAVRLERCYWDAHNLSSPSNPSWWCCLRKSRSRNKVTPSPNHSQALEPSIGSPAIVIKHLVKQFHTSLLPQAFYPWRWPSHQSQSDPDSVTAIADLSFTVPRGGIFVLLGSNGAGKSTALGIMAGLIGRSGGSVVFPPSDATSSVIDKEAGDRSEWEGPSRPPRGSLGIVPQQNVLFPELTCFQTMQLWSAVKCPSGRHSNLLLRNQRQAHVEEMPEDLERLLIDCGLEGKLHADAASLSGGQKRKLQLAIGLVGGSESGSSIVSLLFQDDSITLAPSCSCR